MANKNITTRESGLKWLYYKIYIGSVSGGIDYIITQAFRNISLCDKITRWHFLRYTDHGGGHVRLRLETNGDPTALRPLTDPIIRQVLLDLPTLPPSHYRPTIMRSKQPTLPTQSSSDVKGAIRVEIDQYVPDTETFGEEGITIAEDLFHSSSTVAMRVLTDEHDAKYSRKTIIPIFMKAVGDSFAPGGGQQFWDSYAFYWSDYITQAFNGNHQPTRDHWHTRFALKAQELKRQHIAIITPDCELHPDALSSIKAWRDAVSRAERAFHSLTDSGRCSSYDLAFQFLHSMNNRLGLMPMEEAYFASLISQTFSDDIAL
jgi:thiopeptide-type bacteriocin biosynthesis protein